MITPIIDSDRPTVSLKVKPTEPIRRHPRLRKLGPNSSSNYSIEKDSSSIVLSNQEIGIGKSDSRDLASDMVTAPQSTFCEPISRDIIPKSTPRTLGPSFIQDPKKFSNRYLFESCKCHRYQLLENFLSIEKTFTETLREPREINNIYLKNPKPRLKINNLVVNNLELKKKILKEGDNKRLNPPILKNGSQWTPKNSVLRSEVPWFRRHMKQNEKLIPQEKLPRNDKNLKSYRINKAREGNSFFGYN